jgi:hypothetical protein
MKIQSNAEQLAHEQKVMDDLVAYMNTLEMSIEDLDHLHESERIIIKKEKAEWQLSRNTRLNRMNDHIRRRQKVADNKAKTGEEYREVRDRIYNLKRKMQA